MQTFIHKTNLYCGSPPWGYVHKDLSLWIFIHILEKVSVVHCTILPPLHLISIDRISISKIPLTQLKDLLQPQQYKNQQKGQPPHRPNTFYLYKTETKPLQKP
jgi:hypothetical protein